MSLKLMERQGNNIITMLMPYSTMIFIDMRNRPGSRFEVATLNKVDALFVDVIHTDKKVR